MSDYYGLDELEKQILNTLTVKYPKHARAFIRKVSNDIKRDAKDNTPEDTGDLKKSWKVKTKGKSKASARIIEGYISNDARHSHLIENGHVIANAYGEYGYWEGEHMLEKAVIKKEQTYEEEVIEFLNKSLEELRL